MSTDSDDASGRVLPPEGMWVCEGCGYQNVGAICTHCAASPPASGRSLSSHLYAVPEVNGRCAVCGGHPIDPQHDQPITGRVSSPEQPYGPGAICEDCGHFAERHNEGGCTFDRPAPLIDCACPSMRWLGTRWPRPWLPAPEGLTNA